MYFDVIRVEKRVLWGGRLVIRLGRVVKVYFLDVWFLRGMENRFYYILGF